MDTKCVFFLITLLMLEQVSSQSGEESSSILPTSNHISLDQGVALTVNNYLTSFIALAIDINKSLTGFMHEIQSYSANFFNLTEVKLAAAATSNDCTGTENLAVLNLLTNTENSLAQCMNDFSPLTSNVLSQISNLLQQGTSILSRNLQNISGCVLNSSHALIGLPGCLITNIFAIQMDFSQLVSHLTDALSADLGSIGGVTHASYVCLNDLLNNFVQKATSIIFNFITCTSGMYL